MRVTPRLTSALADVSIRQGIAVTGAVNQHGEVQAVGGVTRKIEGFFAVCQARGLSGDQGVIIPRATVRHLMLDKALLAAVRSGAFHVWAVGNIDEGLELLTGCPPGTRGTVGPYPPDSIHARVEARLRHYVDAGYPCTRSGATAMQNGRCLSLCGWPPA